MHVTEHSRFWRDRDLPWLEIRHALDSRHAFPMHTHDTYSVGFMERGACYTLGPRNPQAVVSQGKVSLINPGQVHAGEPTGASSTYRMFYLDPAWICRQAEELRDGGSGDPEFPALVAEDRTLERLFFRLHGLVDAGETALAKETALAEAVSRLLCRHGNVRDSAGGSNNEPLAVRRVKDYLLDNLCAKVDLDDLCRVAGLSRFHLVRVFRRATGLPPHAFQNQARVELSKQLLRQGLPLAQVAVETGFFDQSHFSRVFKRFVGGTPKQYAALPALPCIFSRRARPGS